jgi:hypothetical protein
VLSDNVRAISGELKITCSDKSEFKKLEYLATRIVIFENWIGPLRGTAVDLESSSDILHRAAEAVKSS